MSEEEKPKPAVCDHFEPQAWRKTVCKNCFQHPDVHAGGTVQNGDISGTDKGDQTRDGSVEKGEKSAAASLKNKYEQLERDKYKPKDVESHTLPRTKKAGGLALITEKYDQLDRQAGRLDSPTKGVPPPTPPKTYKKGQDGGGLTKFKFGSVENVSSERQPSEGKIGLKLKFGSMEDISTSVDQKKDSISTPSTKSTDKNIDVAAKLDAFQKEVKSGSASKVGQTVIHKQKDGNVDIIKIPNKQKDTDKSQDATKHNLESTEKTNKFEKTPTYSTGKDDEKVSSKFGLKSKFDLKSPTPEKDNKPDFKQANTSLSSSKETDSKLDHNKIKTEAKTEDKIGKTGFQKPDMKTAQTDKEDNKLSSLKEKLNKPSKQHDKEDTKVKSMLKSNQENSTKGDGFKDHERKTPTLTFKDQLKSPESDSNPLSKLKNTLKSPTIESDNKQNLSWKDKLKSPSNEKDKKDVFKLHNELKSPTPEKEKIPDFKSKLKPSTPKEDKDSGVKSQIKSNELEIDKKTVSQESENKTGLNYRDTLKTKTNDKKAADDLKSKFDSKTKKPLVEESSTSLNKALDLRGSLKKPNETKSKDEKKVESKNKIGFPLLKSKAESLVCEKDQESKAKLIAKDDKSRTLKVGKLSNKLEKEESEKVGLKNKFELPKLKGSTEKESDESRPNLKSKFEAKDTESPSASKNKFEIPVLKKVTTPEPEKEKVTVSATNSCFKDDDTKPVERLKSKNNENEVNDMHLNDSEKSCKESVSDTTSKDSVTSRGGYFQKNKDEEKTESSTLESKESNNTKAPESSDISKKSFENISADTEAISSDACASEVTREKSPLHVDTQVFTSSRSKTAGVNRLDNKHLDNIENASGFSNLNVGKGKGSSTSLDKGDKNFLVNGDISSEHEEKKIEDEKLCKETKNEVGSNREIEELKAELLNMTERCQNLETENEMLRSDLNKKGATESTLRKQRDEVENSIKGLRTHLKTLEDKCTHLETENLNLMNDLKAKHEDNHNKPQTKETEEMDERLTTKEKIMDDMMEENEQLKQEINELKVEMEEMYDSFRDQEAEEFREIQKELEFTAKNCRILQFKLRKMERRNEQLEQDKNQFEDRLRKLQNSFQDRDAVAHIHSLEDELRMAKEVSVRLHDELDLMEDRRSKLEEENRHLTELLEQADRKQFRLELEVDKLRDKVIELRQELRTREGGPEGEEPRKLNCAEFLALHRGTI